MDGSEKKMTFSTACIGWKHGVVSKPNRFIDTEPIVQMTEQNMKYIGEEIFKAAREMFYEDNELKD